MNVPHGTWVIVADGGKYLVLENTGDADILLLNVLRHAEQDNPPDREQSADRPGRLEDAGVGRSAVQETDWHEVAKERFAKELAEKLCGWALDKRFDRLILVADPATLGQLRPELHDSVRAALVGELAKDLTNHPIDAIEGALADA